MGVTGIVFELLALNKWKIKGRHENDHNLFSNDWTLVDIIIVAATDKDL